MNNLLIIKENILKDTPVIEYNVGNRIINVKREDLCTDEAKFSKIRGVFSHLQNISSPVIGVLDTYHSKAGWGVSYICSFLNKKAVVFYPEFKNEPGIRESQINAKRLGAEIIPLKAGMSSVLWYQSRKRLKELYGEGCYMISNGLKLDESIVETSLQVDSVDKKFFKDTTWMISISTGTIAIGVLKGLLKHNADVNVILHLGYSRNINNIEAKIEKALPNYRDNIILVYVDEKYDYKDYVEFPCEFPCNKYYDLKAWKWLVNNMDQIDTKNIMFWNIGE